ncbi:hypothetical protein SAMN04487948_10231 [Halogranum amylolyticum]|uniref:Uncharacterized protein n=1 Tax=Halogranum amylolyticum TaxID=660520 RepID=A0A1H8P0W9_9EURY|nr:hypothetical protein [Halogranum amylolyticum]SEO35522.1 hypothetical protein SAMN04487948_10231 [Halogranum amylolyticum]
MRRSRAQTTIDFAIGAGVFLLAVAFVVAFIPGMLDPYEGIQRETVTADRVATQLSTDLLGDPNEPYTLDTDCTVAFFGDTSPTTCRFTGSDLTERISVGDTQSVDVMLVADLDDDDAATTLCWDTDSESLVEEGAAVCDVDELLVEQTSDPPTDTGSVVVAHRIVSLANTDVTLLVRMW